MNTALIVFMMLCLPQGMARECEVVLKASQDRESSGSHSNISSISNGFHRDGGQVFRSILPNRRPILTRFSHFRAP